MNTITRIEGEFSTELEALQALREHDISNKNVTLVRKPTAREKRATDYLWSEHDYRIQDEKP